MFSRITGRIVDRKQGSVVIESGGLAYEIFVPPCVEEKLREATDAQEPSTTLEIYPSFSLDGNSGRFTFFGFTNTIERDFFEALLSVASIGPKTAARAFSLPMARIARAIDAGDHAVLTGLPGIGKQKARDIVANLQGKVTKFLFIQDAQERPTQPIPDFAAEALAVLLQLAYKRSEAEAMIKQTLEAAPRIDDAQALLAEVYRRRVAG
jgi:Holliday junction DNA helicase RuvA